MNIKINVKILITISLVVLAIIMIFISEINNILIQNGYEYISQLNIFVIVVTVIYYIILHFNNIRDVNVSLITVPIFLYFIKLYVSNIRPLVSSPESPGDDLLYSSMTFCIIYIVICILSPYILSRIYRIRVSRISNMALIVIIVLFYYLYPVAKELEYRWGDQFYPKYLQDQSINAINSKNPSICNNITKIYYTRNYLSKYHNKNIKYRDLNLYETKYYYRFPEVALLSCYSTFFSINENNADKCIIQKNDLNMYYKESNHHARELDKCEMMLIEYNCIKLYNMHNKIKYKDSKIMQSLKLYNHNNVSSNLPTLYKEMLNNFDIAAGNNNSPLGYGYVGNSTETKYIAGEITDILYTGVSGLYDIQLKGNHKTAKIRLKTILYPYGMRKIYININDIEKTGIINDDKLTKIKVLKFDENACNYYKFDYTKY